MAFWDHVEKTATCWMWRGATTKGYGQCTINKVHKYAHRASWEFKNGPIPEGLVVCHSCDQPLCVNPAHLFIGTHADNIMDCLKKGRARRRPLIGPENPMAKRLPKIDVERILDLFRSGLGVREIAPLVGVSKSTVHNIVNGNHWSVRNGI